MNKLMADLFRLSPAERIQLADDLWDSVAIAPEDMPRLTDAEHAEIERRLSDHASDPSSAATWQDARARLWSRIG